MALLLQLKGKVDFIKTLFWFHIITPLAFVLFAACPRNFTIGSFYRVGTGQLLAAPYRCSDNLLPAWCFLSMIPDYPNLIFMHFVVVRYIFMFIKQLTISRFCQ
jgi:hypothetical protein